MIGCGFPSEQNVDVKIVSTDTLMPLSEDRVGEIWIRSDSKAGGYYKKPEISKMEFFAEIGVDPEKKAGRTNFDPTDGYLRTGDLGFMHNQELFVCGRLKDLIIIGGRNYYPQDIEATVEAVDPKIRPGCSAAFTIDPISGGDEQVAVVLELREIPAAESLEAVCDQLATVLRGAIMQEHSLSVAHITLLVPKTVPKTSSGKISRARCRKGFLDKSLKTIYSKSFAAMAPMEIEGGSGQSGGVAVERSRKVDAKTIRSLSKKEIRKKLMNEISKQTSMPQSTLKRNVPLSTMMDSLSLSQFKGSLENEYATNISDGYLFRDSTTIDKLVEVVKLGYAPDDGDDDVPGADQKSGPAVGESKGVSGALGCPPGVCCVVM